MEKKAVNLLQQRGAPPTFWENLYDWVTNTCRIIVVITELLVLGAFGWRFWLDRRLNDLKDEIEYKGEVLKSLAGQEKEIRILQDKINTYKGLWENSSNYSSVLQELNGYIPVETEELSVGIAKTEEGRNLTISGEIARDKVSELENSLKDSASFSDVALSSIERKSEGANVYTFTLITKIISEEGREPLVQSESSESTT